MAKNSNDGRARKPMSEVTKAKLALARAKPRTGVHEFVGAWLDGDSIRGIAQALDVTPASVMSRAKVLRKLSVNLPERPSGATGRGAGGRRIGYSAGTVEALNALIAGTQGSNAVISAGRATVNDEDNADDIL